MDSLLKSAGKAVGIIVAGKVISNVAEKAVECAFDANEPRSRKATKKDLELARLQVEKAKIDERTRRQELARSMMEQETAFRARVWDQVTDILEYTTNNSTFIISRIRSLQNECISIMDQINQSANSSMQAGASFWDKRLMKKAMKETDAQATVRFQYLYLCKDYLSFLSMHANGLLLTDLQSAFILKFAPFFSGVPVLQIQQNNNCPEDGFSEQSVKIINTKNGVGAYSDFSFVSYLNYYYKAQLRNYILPDIDGTIQLLTNAINKRRNALLKGSSQIRCEYCDCLTDKSNGVCMHCGAPLPYYCI